VKTWSRQLLIILLAIGTLLGAGCSRSKDEAPPYRQSASPVFTVAETGRTLQNVPLYTALEKGFFGKQDLNIELVARNDLQQAAKDLQAGNIHFLITTCDKIFYFLQQGLGEFRLIGQLSTTDAYQLLARQTTGSFQWQDMKGKVLLGYQGGDLPYTLFYNQLRSQNLRPFITVQPVENLAYCQIPAVFRAGSGHYLLAEEPLVSMLESEGSAQIINSVRVADPGLPAQAVIVSKSFLEQNMDSCAAFLQALTESLAWLDQEAPAEIAAQLQGYFPEYPEKVLQRAAGRYKNKGCWQGPAISSQALETVQAVMLQEKELRQPVPLAQLLESPQSNQN